MLTFTCLKVGNKYSSDYVNGLYVQVKRNLNVPHRFICITDDPTNVLCETVKEETGLPGWWGKLGLFRREAYGLSGRILFCDLDNLIVGNLDTMARSTEPLVAVEDFTHPGQFNSAFFAMEVGSNPQVWDEFNPERMIRTFGDQDWITPRVKFSRWPQEWIVSFKREARTSVPFGASVVCFHGDPKPPMAPGWAGRTWKEASTYGNLLQRNRASVGLPAPDPVK